MKRFLLVSLFLFLLLPLVFAADWVARYNGTGNGSDCAYAIAVDGSGNVYVTGFARRNNDDYATIKYNPTNGDTFWVRTYNGPANNTDGAYAIAVDGSSNVYVTGRSWGNNFDYATIKYNSSGVQQWVKRYDGPIKGADEANAIAVDGSGNVYVTGYSYGSNSVEDYATIKYNSSGESLWAVRYNGPGNSTDYVRAMAVDGSGNVYVTGRSYGGSSTNYDYATIKYNSSGVQQWVKRYNGAGNGEDDAYDIAVDGSGNVYVTGSSYGGSSTGYDYATIKYNSSGESLWAVRYNGPANNSDGAYAIAVHQYGSVFVTGYSYGGSDTRNDYATIKYNSSGVEQWVKRYNGPGNGNDYALAIAVSDDPYANVYITGLSYGSGTGDDYATIKYSRLGDSMWAERYNYNGTTFDRVTAIAYYSGAVYVTGYSETYPGTGSYDYLTIKYSPPVGIEEVEEYAKTGENLIVYPTFAVANTKIHYALPKGGRVLLEVFDGSGRLIRTLTDEHKKAGTYNAIWDGRDENGKKVALGAYFFTLKVADQATLRKVLLLR